MHGKIINLASVRGGRTPITIVVLLFACFAYARVLSWLCAPQFDCIVDCHSRAKSTSVDLLIRAEVASNGRNFLIVHLTIDSERFVALIAGGRDDSRRRNF